MGFGLLFLGYFITYIMAMNTYGALFRLVGYAIMYYAVYKLTAYNSRFKIAGYTAIGLVVLSVVDSVHELTNYLYANMIISVNPFPHLMSDIILYFEAGIVLLYHIFLLLAILDLANETGVKKVKTDVIRDFIFMGVYYVLRVIGFLPLPIKEAYARNMGLPLTILYLVWIVLELELIFTCYRHICDENDLEMERKPSRFEFVNKIRAELDRKQEKAQAENEKYRREKMERKRNKRSK